MYGHENTTGVTGSACCLRLPPDVCVRAEAQTAGSPLALLDPRRATQPAASGTVARVNSLIHSGTKYALLTRAAPSSRQPLILVSRRILLLATLDMCHAQLTPPPTGRFE